MTISKLDLQPTPQPEWQPLKRPGTQGVEVRVHLVTEQVFIAELRFAAHARIDPHPGERAADVVCLAGTGFVSLDGESASFNAGQRIHWPAEVEHQLWTEETSMRTLMVERLFPE